MTGPKLTNPNELLDTFSSGPMSLVTAGSFAVLTFSQVRFDHEQVGTGRPDADQHAVVVARIVMPLSQAKELQGMLARVLP